MKSKKTALLANLLGLVFGVMICNFIGCGVYRLKSGKKSDFPIIADTVVKSYSHTNTVVKEQPINKTVIVKDDKVGYHIFRDSTYLLFKKLFDKVDKTNLKLDTGMQRQRLYIVNQDSMMQMMLSVRKQNIQLKADTAKLHTKAKITTDQKTKANLWTIQVDYSWKVIVSLLTFLICINLVNTVLILLKPKRKNNVLQ